MVNWNAPLEAVNKVTGRVVPVTRLPSSGTYGYRTTCPDNATSNEGWYADGTDKCATDAWFVRNITEPAGEWRVRCLTKEYGDWSDLNGAAHEFSSKAEALAHIADQVSDDLYDRVVYRYVLETRPAPIWTAVEYEVNVSCE